MISLSRLSLALALTSMLSLAGCATQNMVSTTDVQSNAQRGLYSVSGAVLRPGEFGIAPGEQLTLGQAIRRSGGFKPGNTWDDGANPDAVHVQRVVNGAVVEYTLHAFPGERGEVFFVLPGDYISVPKRIFTSPVPNPLPFAT